MSFNKYFIFLIFLFQHCFSQEVDLKFKATELGYDRIRKHKSYDRYFSYKDDLKGILDENFNVLVPTEYPFSLKQSEDLVRLKNTMGKYFLYNIREKEMILENYFWISDYIEFIKENEKSLIFEARKNNNDPNSLFSENGRLLFNLEYNYSVSLHGGSSVGVLLVYSSSNNNFIMIDDSGEKKANFPYIFHPFNNKDFFIVRKDNYINGENIMKYGLINHQGEFLLDLKYDKIISEKEFIILRLNNEITILDKNLQTIINSKTGIYAEIIEENSFLILTPNNYWQLYDLSDSLVMEHKAKKIQYYRNNIFQVTSDTNEIYFIDNHGAKISFMEGK